jgi:hypothetical protein
VAADEEVISTATPAGIEQQQLQKEKNVGRNRITMLATGKPTNLPFTAMSRPTSNGNGNGNGNGHSNGNNKKMTKTTSPTMTTTPPNSRGMFRPRHQSLNIGSLSILGRRSGSSKEDSSLSKTSLSGATTSPTTAVGGRGGALGRNKNRNSIAGPIMNSSYYDRNKPLPPIVDGGDEDSYVVVEVPPVPQTSTIKSGVSTAGVGKGRPLASVGLTVMTESASIPPSFSSGYGLEQQQIPSTPSSPTTESKPHQRRRSFLPSSLMTSNLAKFVSGNGGSNSATTTPTGTSFAGPSSPTATATTTMGDWSKGLNGDVARDRLLPEGIILDGSTLLTIEQFKWGVLCCCHAIKNRGKER